MATSYDYTDEFTKQLARKRRLAELLQQQSMSGLQLSNPHARASWLNALVPLAQAWAGKSISDESNTEGTAHEQSQAKAMQDAIAQFTQSNQGLPERSDMNLPGDLSALAPDATTRPSTDVAAPMLPKPPAPPPAAPMVPQPPQFNFSGSPKQKAELQAIAESDIRNQGAETLGPQGLTAPPPMPAPQPTPQPTLAGPPPPGALAAPPDQAPPPLIPQAPGQPDMAPKGMMLPAQPGKTPNAFDMLKFASQLPPGQQQQRFMDEALKNTLTEPGRLDARAQHEETMRSNAALAAAVKGQGYESAERRAETRAGAMRDVGTGHDASAERRAEVAAKAKVDSATISATARGQVGQVSLTQEDANRIAEQVWAGDKSGLTGLGYGSTGAANRAFVQSAITKKAQEMGKGGADLAAKNMEFSGIMAGSRAAGTRGANVELAVSEASKMGALIESASEQVNRTDFIPVNKAINAYLKNTGDVPVRQLGAAINSFINAYARAVTPVGQSTVSDKDHAREMMSAADSHEQLLGIVAQLQKEMEAARAAPKEVREQLREAVGGGAAPSKGPKVGDVEGGYRFKGGDPSKKENWEKV